MCTSTIVHNLELILYCQLPSVIQTCCHAVQTCLEYIQKQFVIVKAIANTVCTNRGLPTHSTCIHGIIRVRSVYAMDLNPRAPCIHKRNLLVFSQVSPIWWRGSPHQSSSLTLLRSWSLKQEHQEDINGLTGTEMEVCSVHHHQPASMLSYHVSFQTFMKSLLVSPPPRMTWECIRQTFSLHLGKHKHKEQNLLSQDTVRPLFTNLLQNSSSNLRNQFRLLMEKCHMHAPHANEVHRHLVVHVCDVTYNLRHLKRAMVANRKRKHSQATYDGSHGGV